MPQVSWTRWRERTKRELYECPRAGRAAHLSAPRRSRGRSSSATAAYDKAVRAPAGTVSARRRRCAGAVPSCSSGRPYNVLSPEMSKGIPDIFGSLGVKTFYQDMVPYGPDDVERIAPLLDMVHWLHAAKILEVACVAADTPNLYPVFITSFKCTPDSFAMEYFKRILDAKAKPYLILQLDDHDSTLGYETRIEAGVASFRNHFQRAREPAGDAKSRPRSFPSFRGR